MEGLPCEPTKLSSGTKEQRDKRNMKREYELSLLPCLAPQHSGGVLPSSTAEHRPPQAQPPRPKGRISPQHELSA